MLPTRVTNLWRFLSSYLYHVCHATLIFPIHFPFTPFSSSLPFSFSPSVFLESSQEFIFQFVHLFLNFYAMCRYTRNIVMVLFVVIIDFVNQPSNFSANRVSLSLSSATGPESNNVSLVTRNIDFLRMGCVLLIFLGCILVLCSWGRRVKLGFGKKCKDN